jgi:hypothetical protein
MRRVAIPDEPPDLADADRGLRDEQLGRSLQPSGAQVLAEGRPAEVGVGTLDLARRAGQGRRQRAQRQRAAVAPGDEGRRLCVEATPRRCSAVAHTTLSDRCEPA